MYMYIEIKHCLSIFYCVLVFQVKIKETPMLVAQERCRYHTSLSYYQLTLNKQLHYTLVPIQAPPNPRESGRGLGTRLVALSLFSLSHIFKKIFFNAKTMLIKAGGDTPHQATQMVVFFIPINLRARCVTPHHEAIAAP